MNLHIPSLHAHKCMLFSVDSWMRIDDERDIKIEFANFLQGRRSFFCSHYKVNVKFEGKNFMFLKKQNSSIKLIFHYTMKKNS